jgi:flagellar biosynthesis/type III secretory pathway protein FliH
VHILSRSRRLDYHGRQEDKNRRTREQRNKGTREQRNKGTKEQGNKGTKEQGNEGTREQCNTSYRYGFGFRSQRRAADELQQTVLMVLSGVWHGALHYQPQRRVCAIRRTMATAIGSALSVTARIPAYEGESHGERKQGEFGQ